MSKADKIEQLYGCTPPAKQIIHVYAVGGNSISLGTLQYNTTLGNIYGLSAPLKAKYWDAVHTNIWRLHNSYMGNSVNARDFTMKYVEKANEPLFTSPEGNSDAFSSPMIIFPRLKELYNNTIHIGFCHVGVNGTGTQNLADTFCWNVEQTDAQYQSKNGIKRLGRNLQLTVRHLTAMGYDVRVKGILLLGQSVIDCWGFQGATYDKATFKTDFTNTVNYFRNTLGYTNVPFYTCETTQVAAYPTESAAWNDAITELNALLGGIHLFYGHHWWDITADGTHPDGRSGCLAWGEGAETSGRKNLAELIYSVETS